MPQLISPDGTVVNVPEEQAGQLQAGGYRPITLGEAGHILGAERPETSEGALSDIGAGASSLLSGATLGLSDVALKSMLSPGAFKRLAADREAHPIISGGGQLAGALATGGAAAPEEAAGIGARILAHSPAGLAGKVGHAVSGLGEGAGLAARVAAGTAGAAAEGALYGGGQYLTETALQDKPLSAEGFVAGMGHGALFGAPIGAAGTLASATLQRAASLFPRSEVSAAAAAGVKEQASGALAQTVRDGDVMVQAAERKLSDIDAGIGMAQTGEGATRRVFGAADPQALADQVTGATARQEVNQALEGYQQARAQFEDWLATEADPAFAAAFGKLEENRPALDRMLGHADQGDLEDLLGAVRGGSRDEKLQAAMRRTLDEPDVLGAGGVPVDEFGAPGARGIKTPEELQRIAEGSAGDGLAPALAPEDATGAGGPRALRAQGTPAGGVPAQEIVERGMAEQPATAVGKRTSTGSEPAGIPDHAAIKAHEDRVDAALERTVPAREIAERGYYELPIKSESPGMTLEEASSVRMDKARAAIAEGQREPIDLTVSPSGKIFVTGGRHRLQAAIEADAPIKVKWSTGSEPAASDMLRHGSATAAGDDLLAQLRGTAAKVDEGQTIGRIGAESPARAEYVTNRAAKQKSAAEHFRAEALAKRPFEGPINLPHSFDRAARAITGKSAEVLAADLRGAPTGIPERARVAGRYGAAAAEAGPADPLAAFGLESDPTRLGAAGGEVPAEVRALALPERTAVDTGIKARMGAVKDERAIAKAIMRHNGKNADMGPRIAREAKVIGDLEAANARLADALGSEAPPTAVTSAKAFHEAIAKAQERAAASSAKLGADLQNKVPAMTGGTDATVVDDDVAKALRKHESRAAARAEKTTVSPAPEMPAEFPAAPTPTETPVAAAAPPTGGLGSKAADVGSALEVMRAIGMHVPAVSHIPVIGPILGLWLKARAVMGIIGRKGGSIGKSTEGLIASKSAAVQDRIVKATGALLEVGARAAKQASHLAGPAVLLSGSLFPGGEKPASDKPRDLFEARSSEITRAMQPGAVDQAIAQRFPTSDPAMHDAIVAQVQRGIAFLDTKRPKQTVLPGVLPGDGTWAPSAAAIEEFGKYVHAVNDPVSVLEDLAKGHPSAEGAETLRAVYPQLYQYAQKQLLAAAPEMARTLPYSRRVMLSILYQIPVDGTMQPSHAQFLQTPAPAPPAGKPPTAGPLRLGQQTMSPLDQRAAGA